MVQWNFYFSGILYGKIWEEDQGLTWQKLLIKDGTWSEGCAYTEESDKELKTLCSRSILHFFREKAEYESKIASEPVSFITENGDEFTNRRGESYIQRNKTFPMDLFYDETGIYAVLMSGRDYTAVLVKKGQERRTVLADWEKVYPEKSEKDGEYQPGPVYPVELRGTFQVPTRDGELLATDVYLPNLEKEKTYPAVLVRTPYGKSNGKEKYYRYVQRGYAVVIQDTRGREDSTGEWIPQYFEVEDGDDTLNWIAAQEFSDGQVSMTGGSYLGYVQWAAAASGNPHLKAMLSSVCAGSAFVDNPRKGGCFMSGILAWAFAVSGQRMTSELMEQDNWDEIMDIRPIKDIPKRTLGYEVPFFSKWLSHTDMDDFWRQGNWSERYEGHPVPALILSGWFDDDGMGTTEALDLVRDWPAGTWKTVLGPWKHSGNADYDLHGLSLGENALRYDLDVLCMMWLEHFLKDVENGVERTPAVEYYTIGENCWKSAQVWPPECTQTEVFYLAGEDAAGTKEACGNGELLRGDCFGASAYEAGKNVYEYDPKNPSVHVIDVSENEMQVPGDYTEEEKRADVLSYSTPILKEPLTVTGDMNIKLYISCDCPDTDFVLRITDVDEYGKSVKLADAVISARYRNGFERPEYLTPGEIYEINVRTTKISNTFLPGHRMRLTATSSAKNLIFPNSNTRQGFDSEIIQKAEITVYHGGQYPSRICVPVEI